MREMGSRDDLEFPLVFGDRADTSMTLGTIYANACSRPSTSVTCIVCTLSRKTLVSMAPEPCFETSPPNRLCAICSILLNDILRSDVSRMAPPGSAEHDGN